MASQFDNFSKKNEDSRHADAHLLCDGVNDTSSSGDISAQELKDATEAVYVWQVRVLDPDAIDAGRRTITALVRVPIAQLPALNGLLYDILNERQDNLDRIADLEQLVEKDLGYENEAKELRETNTRLRAALSDRNIAINQLEHTRWEREERGLVCQGRGRTGLRRLWENISTAMIRMKSPKGAGRS